MRAFLRTDSIPERAGAPNTPGPLPPARYENEYSNDRHLIQQEGSGDDYCSIDRDHRISYDVAGEDARVRPNCVNFNPYNRGINDMENTEYDLSTRIQKAEPWDPTYSHLPETPVPTNVTKEMSVAAAEAPVYSQVIKRLISKNSYPRSEENETRESTERNSFANAVISLRKITEGDTENENIAVNRTNVLGPCGCNPPYPFNSEKNLNKEMKIETDTAKHRNPDNRFFSVSSSSEDSTTVASSDEFTPSSSDNTSEIDNTEGSYETSFFDGSSVTSETETADQFPQSTIAVNMLYQDVSIGKGMPVLEKRLPSLDERSES